MAVEATLGVAAAVSSGLELHLVLIISSSVFNSATANVKTHFDSAFLIDFISCIYFPVSVSEPPLSAFLSLRKKKGEKKALV